MPNAGSGEIRDVSVSDMVMTFPSYRQSNLIAQTNDPKKSTARLWDFGPTEQVVAAFAAADAELKGWMNSRFARCKTSLPRRHYLASVRAALAFGAADPPATAKSASLEQRFGVSSEANIR